MLDDAVGRAAVGVVHAKGAIADHSRNRFLPFVPDASHERASYAQHSGNLRPPRKHLGQGATGTPLTVHIEVLVA